MNNLNDRMLELMDDDVPGTVSRHKFSLNFLTEYHPAIIDKLIKNNALCLLVRILVSIGMVYGFSLLYIEITKLNLGWNMERLPLFIFGASLVMIFMLYMHETNKRNYLRSKHHE